MTRDELIDRLREEYRADDEVSADAVADIIEYTYEELHGEARE